MFDIRHHQDYSSAQPIKLKFDFRPDVPAALNLIGLNLNNSFINEKISISELRWSMEISFNLGSRHS